MHCVELSWLQLNRIDNLPTGEYVIRPTYNVSSNCTIWQPRLDSNQD